MCWHKWSKWESMEATYTWRPQKFIIQLRHCLKCGVRQRKNL